MLSMLLFINVIKKASMYESSLTDQLTTLTESYPEYKQPQGIKSTIKVKQPALSSPGR